MPSGDVKRLALVGYGKIAPKHLEAFRALGAEFVACCNRSESGRDRARSEGGITTTYSSITEMLERERPDGVVCTVTFPEIYRATKEILGSGIPVLVEKPPGTSLDELADLRRVSEQAETPVMVGLNRRHYSVFLRALEDAGGPDAISSVFVDWTEDPDHVLKRLQPEHVARWIFGNTLHGLDLMVTLGGAVEDPKIEARSFGEPFRWVMALQGRSERGAVSSFRSTWDSPGGWRVALGARGRRYVFAPLESCTVSERGREDRVIEPSEDDRRFKPGFLRQARTFLQSIDARKVPDAYSLASSEPAMRLAELLTAALRVSAQDA